MDHIGWKNTTVFLKNECMVTHDRPLVKYDRPFIGYVGRKKLILIINTPGKNSLRQRKEPVAAENRAHVARGMTLKKKLYI